jgi:hypothetical protein
MKYIRFTGLIFAVFTFIANYTFAQDSEPEYIGGFTLKESCEIDRQEMLTNGRAYEAVMWAIPVIQAMQTKEELFKHSGKRNSLGYMSKPPTSTVVVPTFNNTSAYVFGNVSLKEKPMVLEFPAASEEGKYFGSFFDVWNSAIEDFGVAGIDKGKGGKFLLTSLDCHYINQINKKLFSFKKFF